MDHSGLEHPPDGIDMFINDRLQQMEREAVRTTYCKIQRKQRRADGGNYSEESKRVSEDSNKNKVDVLNYREWMWRVN